jgi:diguanylate cyclase (GGDEF)-like protein/PAS domain S-box-containing protein
MRLFATLRSRLLVLVLLTVVPVLGLLLHAYAQQREQAFIETEQEAHRLLRLALKDHRALVEGAHQLLATLGRTRETRSTSSSTCSAFLASVLAHERPYINFGVIDPHGHMICSAVPLRRPIDVSDRRWFQRALQVRGFTVGDYQVGRVTNKQVITFAQAVVGESGQIEAVVFAAADLTWLQHLVDAIDLPADTVALVTDSNGKVLARYPESATWVGERFLGTPIGVSLSNASESATLTVRGPDGIDRLYAASALPSATGNLYLLLGVSKPEALARADHVLAVDLAWLAAATVIAFLLAWFGANMLILRGTNALVRAARELGAGNLRARTGLTTSVIELERLAQAFDQMAGALERRDAERARADRERAALEKERERAAEFGSILDDSSNEIYIFDADTLRLLHVNTGACRNLGYTRPQLCALTLLDLGGYTDAHLETLLRDVKAGTRPGAVFETQHRRRDGTRYPVDVRLHAALFDGRAVYTAVVNDITARKQAEQQLADSEDRLRLALDSSGEGLWDWDLATRKAYYDVKWAEIMGQDPARLAPTIESWEQTLHPEDAGATQQILVDHLAQARPLFEAEYRTRQPSGAVTWVAARGRVIKRDENGRALRMIGTIHDITRRKQAEEQLAYLAQYDTLTGLPNRHLFRDRLSRAMIRAKRNESMIALMFLDLDGFKQTNDTLGHAAGDALLQAVAGRLQACLRDEDTIARPGGDEFTIVLESVTHVDDVMKVVHKVLGAFAVPFSIEEKNVYATVSVGITLFPLDVDDLDSLLRNADLAMYQAKHDGGNAYRFFSADMSVSSSDRMNLLTCLHRALEHEELHLEYQPQVDIVSGAITGAEALVRWSNEQLGSVPPSAFIQLADESGLIAPIGDWVLRAACAEARRWTAEGLGALRICVNLSARQLRQKDLADVVARALDGLAPDRLELEVTEAALIQAADGAMETIRALREIGVALSVDDFGTGHSSLRLLTQLPVRRLKIDQSVVRGISINPQDAAIVVASVGLAKHLGLKVTAEGVELAEELRFLQMAGCDEYQGFYFSRPLTPAAFAGLLREGRRVAGSGT